jgi:glycosyltransferase involved in cell wall biosynthesis
MARYKNVEFILDNFMKYIRETGNSKLKLVVVGQNREVNFKEYIEAKYGSSESILMLDYINDNSLADLYNAALGFLYMSKYEGFGLPILEAMQCGTPVICSDAASIPEVAGEAAIMMDASDNIAFISALDLVYKEETVRKRLITAGLEQAARFSWEKYASEVVKAYEEM